MGVLELYLRAELSYENLIEYCSFVSIRGVPADPSDDFVSFYYEWDIGNIMSHIKATGESPATAVREISDLLAEWSNDYKWYWVPKDNLTMRVFSNLYNTHNGMTPLGKYAKPLFTLEDV